MQSAIRDGRLQFRDKSKAPIRIDADPLQIADAHYAGPFMVNMVEISEDSGEKADMVEVSDEFKHEAAKGITEDPHQMFPTETAEGFVKQVIEDLNKGTVVIFKTNETTEGFIHVESSCKS